MRKSSASLRFSLEQGLGPLAEVEVEVRPLDAGDGVELRGGQLEEGDLDVLLGRLARGAGACRTRGTAGPAEVVRAVAHQRILGGDARDREDRVRDDRVVQRRDLRDALADRLDVEARGPDGRVRLEDPTDTGLERKSPAKDFDVAAVWRKKSHFR